MDGTGIIVVGGGAGGLSAAIGLAAGGARVTLCDAGTVPGGKIRSVETAAGPAAAGPTVLTMRPVFERLFAEAGRRLDDYVTLIPEPLLARHFWPDGSTLDLHADMEESAEAVGRFAGARGAKQFRAFAAKARRLFETFDAPMMQAADPGQLSLAGAVARHPRILADMAPGRSLAAQLARDFDDPRLAQLFGRYATYVGGSPYDAPALLALVWHAEASGVWRVAGGMGALAAGMARLAAELGVEIRSGCAVARIEAADGRARGVTLADGQRLAGETIVFAGDPRALSEGLLGGDVARAVRAEGVTPRSLSAEVWSFAARPEGKDLAHHNVFFGADPRTEFDAIAAGRAPVDPAIYVCAQDRGTGVRPPDPERFEIIVNAAAGRAPEEVTSCHRRTYRTLATRGLRFTPEPGAAALSQPADFAAMFPGSEGALYGRSPAGLTAGLKRPRARTGIAGLYLAGGGAHPGAGVPMATLSGRHAAAAIAADRASTSRSRPTAMPGGMSTGSPTTGRAPSRSSGS